MNTFSLKIIACDRVFYDGPCEILKFPGYDGQMAILAHHEKMTTNIEVGELHFRTPDGEEHVAICSDGLLKVKNNEVVVLVYSAEKPEEIDEFRAQAAKERAIEQMQQKQPNPPIKNEADNGLLNKRGTISMARTADKDSATSQFFLNVADNAFLDHGQRDFGYAVFGKIVKGMDVADKISQVPTHDVGPYQNVPSKPVVILSAKVLP